MIETIGAIATKDDPKSRLSTEPLLAKCKSPLSSIAVEAINIIKKAFTPSYYEREEEGRLLESILDFIAKHPISLASPGNFWLGDYDD